MFLFTQILIINRYNLHGYYDTLNGEVIACHHIRNIVAR